MTVRHWMRRRRDRDRRVQFVDAYALPASVIGRYRHSFGPLTDEQLGMLVAAARQWFRLVARAPHAQLAVPSAAVNDLWREMAKDPGDYARFCDAAFGRVLPPMSSGVPDSRAMGPALHRTYVLACADEGSGPDRLPLLFRVDWVLDRLDGRVYRPNCGEVRYCAAPEGTTCLRHLARPPRARVSRWRGPPAGGGFGGGGSGVDGTIGVFRATGRR